MRIALSVILGYLIFAASAVLLFSLAHHAPHTATSIGFGLVAIGYGMVFAALAGFIAQRLAHRADLLAALWLALIIALGAAMSLVTTSRQTAHWSQWAAIVLMAPSAIAGGVLGRIASRGRS